MLTQLQANSVLFKSINILSHKRKRLKQTCVLNFVDTDMEDINVSKIFQMKNAIDYLPFNLQDHKIILLITYRLNVTTRKKVFNNKQTVESIN